MSAIDGTTGNDVLTGTADDDVIRGLAGADRLFGLGGNDILLGGAGADLIDGGDGSDTASYADATAGVTVNLAIVGVQNTIGAGNDTLVAVENLVGSDFGDKLAGDGGDNILDGGAGVDTLTYAGAAAGVAVDLARTGAQDTGGAGVDTIRNFENLTGSAFDDRLAGTAGNNIITGGAGIDTVTYAGATAGVSVSLTLSAQQDTIGAGKDTLFGIENITGSAFADKLIGTDGDNVIDGGAGRDTISYATAEAAVAVSLALQDAAQGTGGAGTDTLRNFENLTGSAFDDRLAGDASDNVISGGAGNDTVSYAGATAGVKVQLALTIAQDTIGAGTDTLFNVENLVGSAFDDNLFGSAGDNVIDAGSGDDIIHVDFGSDTIDGGAGVDRLRGDFGAFTTPVATIYNGQTNIWSFSNGSTATNVEDVELTTGSGADSLTLVAGAGPNPGGSVRFDAGDGIDTLTLDLAASPDQSSIGLSSLEGASLYGSGTLGAAELSFTGIERFVATLGAADDDLFIGNAAALSNGPTVAADGGGGNDILTIDFIGQLNVAFTVGTDGIATTTGASFRNFERFDVRLGQFANSVTTGAGDDAFNHLVGNATLDGGGGNDLLYMAGSIAGFTLTADGSGGANLNDSNSADGFQGNVHLRNIETIQYFDGLITTYAAAGTGTADTLAGTSLIDTLTGLGGDDTLTGFGGNDSLDGGTGIDTAGFRGNRSDYVVTTVDATTVTVRDLRSGRDGTDTLHDVERLQFVDANVAARALVFTSPASFSVAENSLAVGTIVATDPGVTAPVFVYSITGGADAALFAIDAASGALRFATAPNFEAPADAGANNVYDLIVTASDGTATAQALQIAVTDVAELPTQTYTGTSAANVFTVSGSEGWTLSGLGGADRLTGGNSADALIGGKGNDVLSGLGGDDLFRVAAGDGIDAIDGGAGFDRIVATSANTVIAVSALSGIEAIDAGGNAGVRLAGTAVADTIDLSGTLLTGIGSISGLGGNDTIIGSAGADRIIGGAGADLVTGGAGADVFAYALATESGAGTVKADRIVDFTPGEDRIDLSAIDANAAVAGNQAFVFIGTDAFSSLGQLRIGTDATGHLALFGNTGGNLNPEFQLSLLNSPAIGVADILL